MNNLPCFLRSLLLTMLLAFVVPLLMLGGLLAGLSLLTAVPGLGGISQLLSEQILSFLAVFGSGQPLHGALTIGLTCGLVGALFDSYTFYRQQYLPGHHHQ
ncbi:hypothetical protein [Geitlerinema sp. PCC 7407]|uniref:hypothetical protein n=1 Tax=Geitlerinema sp. PCC 7407 TaxID=1173025 RepID=UPI00029FFCEA|nr:hypothetical protein [Geitlerinema sp. PCC 7407]AFY66759.1 hypothetical protein GEI7407_2284 [Geitlerinema sp. PCC 7407]